MLLDEEIEKLSKPCDCMVSTMPWYKDSDDKTRHDVDRIMDSKARSIVAMLFWEAKKDDYFHITVRSVFKKACKMLKETK